MPSGQSPHDSGLRRDEGLEREANESSLVSRHVYCLLSGRGRGGRIQVQIVFTASRLYTLLFAISGKKKQICSQIVVQVPRTQVKCTEKNAGVTCCISHGNVHMKLEKYGGENRLVFLCSS